MGAIQILIVSKLLVFVGTAFSASLYVSLFNCDRRWIVSEYGIRSIFHHDFGDRVSVNTILSCLIGLWI